MSGSLIQRIAEIVGQRGTLFDEIVDPLDELDQAVESDQYREDHCQIAREQGGHVAVNRAHGASQTFDEKAQRSSQTSSSHWALQGTLPQQVKARAEKDQVREPEGEQGVTRSSVVMVSARDVSR